MEITRSLLAEKAQEIYTRKFGVPSLQAQEYFDEAVRDICMFFYAIEQAGREPCEAATNECLAGIEEEIAVGKTNMEVLHVYTATRDAMLALIHQADNIAVYKAAMNPSNN